MNTTPFLQNSSLKKKVLSEADIIKNVPQQKQTCIHMHTCACTYTHTRINFVKNSGF